jgi:hypothetical protein
LNRTIASPASTPLGLMLHIAPKPRVAAYRRPTLGWRMQRRWRWVHFLSNPLVRPEKVAVPAGFRIGSINYFAARGVTVRGSLPG